MIKMIPVVDCRDLPPGNEITDCLLDQDVSTHGQNDVAQVHDDGNPFAEWLKEQGIDFSEVPDGKWLDIAIIGT